MKCDENELKIADSAVKRSEKYPFTAYEEPIFFGARGIDAPIIHPRNNAKESAHPFFADARLNFFVCF